MQGFLCEKYFEEYDQIIITFIPVSNEKENSEDDSEDDGNIQEPYDLDDDVTVDGYFLNINNQKNNVCRNDLDDFFGMFDPPDIEPDDILEAKYHNSFSIGVVEHKENIEILQPLIMTVIF